jgi:hypothetical protein
LLEFALAELWVRQAKGRLTHAAYEAIGQAQGALTRYADETYAQLGQREQEQARRIFTQMVQPRQGAEDTRRPVTKAELGEHEWALVQKLADARLLVTNLNPDNQQAAEMVHEAFIRNWQLLRVWIEQDRDFRIWQESFRVHLRQWLNTKNEGDYLSGTHLAEAEVWLKKRAPDLSTVEKDFIRQSLDNAGTRKRSIVLFFALAGGLGAAVGSTVITALAGYFLFASDPDNPLFRSLPQPLVMLVLGLIGALGGGMQGLVTTLGFTLADGLAVKPTWRYRLCGSLLGGGRFGGCLLLVLRMAEAMPSTYSYITAFMFGFIMFGLSSGAITGAIPGIRDQGPLLRQVILGGILPSLA